MLKFDLTVIEPIKGKPGKVVFTTQRFASDINEAVKSVRMDIEGSGWIVVQSAVLKKAKEDVPAEAIEQAA